MAAPEYSALLEVQEHDTVIDQLRHRRETLPERAEREALLARGGTTKVARDEVAAARDVVAQRQASIEADLATSEDRIATIDKRMYSGEVSASRDLQAMADEIKRLKGQVSALEDDDLIAMEEREPLEARVAELDAELVHLADEVHRVEGLIAEGEFAIDVELEREEAARAVLVAGVPDALHDRYEDLRKKLGGIGAAPLNGSSCGGCHLTQPASEVARIKREPADALILCDQCGRILVRPG